MEILNNIGTGLSSLITVVVTFIYLVMRTMKKDQKELRESLKEQDENLLTIIKEQDKSLKDMLKEIKKDITKLYDRTEAVIRHEAEIKNLETRVVNGK